jgi:predicted O-methyltransferase YrrM
MSREDLVLPRSPKVVDTVINTYLQEHIKLTGVREECHQNGMPQIEVSVQQGKLLTLLVSISGAERVLEIGTLGGYSTICLARGVGPTGHVVTLECNPHHAKVAQSNLRLANIRNVEVLVGPALETLPTLFGTPDEPFDFVFIDADKENNAAYVDWAVKLSHPGTVVVVDNVIRDGRVLDRPEKLEFIRSLGNNSLLEASVIQTVGSKGWDGFVLARVTK